MKLHYDRLRIDEALGSFRKPVNNKNKKLKKDKNNVCSTLGPFPGQRNIESLSILTSCDETSVANCVHVKVKAE